MIQVALNYAVGDLYHVLVAAEGRLRPIIRVDVRQTGLLELRVHEILVVIYCVEFLGVNCLGLDVAAQIAVGALQMIIVQVGSPNLQ
mgnify:CR=1 FL=1